MRHTLNTIACACSIGLAALLTAACAPADRAARPAADSNAAAEPDLPPAVVNNAPEPARLELVAEFPDRQVTGVTVSPDGRIFLCFPLWNPDAYQGAVAELTPDGELRPFPDAEWNRWTIGRDLDPATHFVCVQSVVADRRGNLWVLDPAAPQFDGPIEDGPKLVRIDLTTNRVMRIYPFNERIAPPGSYLNDVRIDHRHNHAYLTDSGRGALIVLDLDSGEAKRVLEAHPSTRAEAITPRIGDRPLRDTAGHVPQIHADGIALDPDAEFLYYHALTGYHTYRIPTEALRELADRPDRLADAVQDLGSDVVTDGMHMDAAGNLYYTALEYDGILRRTTVGNVHPVVIHERLKWPDTLAIGPRGHLYITVSQIHLDRRFGEDGSERRRPPYGLFRIFLDIDSPR